MAVTHTLAQLLLGVTKPSRYDGRAFQRVSARELGGFVSGYGTIGFQTSQNDGSVESSLQVVAVYACIRAISGSVSTLPLHLYQEGGREKAPASTRPGDPVRLLTRYPHPRIPAGEFYGLVAAHLAGWGNAFILKNRDAQGRVTSLFPVIPSMVAVRLLVDGKPQYTVTLPDGTQAELDASEVLHVRGFGVDGIVGMSPIAVARKAVESMEMEETYRRNLLQNDARVSGVLTTDGKLSPEAKQSLRASWNANYAGPYKAGGTAVLEEGLRWQQMSLSTEDMQFIEQRRYSVAEIARLFGVPPSIINAETQDSMTYATVEAQGLAYVRDCLMPYLRRIEQALDSDRDIVPEDLAPEFDADALLRAEASTRAGFYETMIRAGVMDADEAREREHLPPRDNDDVADETPGVARAGQETNEVPDEA